MNKPIFVSRDSSIGDVLKKTLKEKKSRFLEASTPEIVTEKDIRHLFVIR